MKGFIVVAFVLLSVIKVVTSLECYSCRESETMRGCKQTTICGQDEICMLRRTVNNSTQKVLYDTECAVKLECDKELDRYRAILTALEGKKREMVQVLAGDTCLIQCCTENLCNNGCIPPTDPPTTASTVSATPKPPAPPPVPTTLKPPTLSTHKFILVPTKPLKTTTAITTSLPSTVSTTTKVSSTVTTTAKITTHSTVPFVPTSAASSTVPPLTTLKTFTPFQQKSTQSVQSTTLTGSHSSSTQSVQSTRLTGSHSSSTQGVQSTRLTGSHASSTQGVQSTTLTGSHSSSTQSVQSTRLTGSHSSSTQSVQSTRLTGSHSSSTQGVQSTRLTGSHASSTQTTMSPSTVTAALLVSKQDCPSNAVHFNGSCYLFINREMPFKDAQSYCAHHKSHLVHVDSKQENEFLQLEMKLRHRGPIQFWIGITDEEIEATWKFYDNGKAALFFDWYPGEPDGTQEFDGNVDADCAVFDPFLGYQWRDEDCSPYQSSEPICEMEYQN